MKLIFVASVELSNQPFRAGTKGGEMPTINSCQTVECTKVIFDRLVAGVRQELSNKRGVGPKTTEMPTWLAWRRSV